MTPSEKQSPILNQNKSYHQADPYTEWRNANFKQGQNLQLHSNFNQDKLQARVNLVTNPATSKNPLTFTDPTDRMAATLAKAQRIINADWYKQLDPRWKNIVKAAYYEKYVVPAYAGNTDYMVELNPKGLVESGNLPIWNRPRVQNDDGTYSSEYSTSFEDEKGHEVLVPTVVNGKFLTPDGKKPPEGSKEEQAMFKQAWQHYLQTGENLGKFDNYQDADAYSIKLHERGSRRFNLQPPDRETWISNIDRPRNPFIYAASDPASYYEPEGYKHFDHFAYKELGAIGDIFRGMSNSGIWQTKQLALASLKLSHFFGAHPTAEGQEVTSDDIQKFADYEKNQTSNISHNIFGNIDFWNQTHPSQTLGEKVGSLTGEIIATLPLYEAIDGGFEAAPELLKGVPGVPKLVDFLSKLGDKIPATLLPSLGESTTTEIKYTYPSLTDILGRTKTGKFLASRLTEAASGYLSQLLQNGSPKDNLSAAMAFMGFGTLGEAGGKVWKAGSNVLAKKFSAEILAQGGRPFQQALTDHASQELEELEAYKNRDFEKWTQDPVLSNELIKKLREEDKVKFDLVSAEKGVLNSLSLVQFGKTFGKLDSAEKAAVRIARANQVNGTINEFPVHAPEIAKAHIEQNLADERKENPYLDQKINYLEQKYGQKFSTELQNAEAEKIKLETGIKSPEKATSKVAQISKLVDEEDEKKLSEAAEVEPRRYVSFKANSLAYFKNPRPKNSQFNVRSWLEDMSDEDFDKELRDHITGPKWFFENPQHLMLWAYQYRNKMDKAFAERIAERLEDIDPTGTPSKWSREAKIMERHLDKLADTGKLFTEGNIFRSSNFDSWGNRTKWQKQLNNEDLEKAEKLQLAKVLQPLKQNFPEDVQNASTSLKNLQMLRRKATSAGEDLKITSKIKSLISSASKGF